jgi:hypothetical protein
MTINTGTEMTAQTPPAEPAAAAVTSSPAITPATAVPFFERRETWLDVADYPGRQVRLWLNVPQSLVNDVSGDDRERRAAALRRMVLAHRVFMDGQDCGPWQDFDQQPLPPPSEPAFWDAIPLDVAVAILRLVSEAPLALPNFRLGTNGR